MDSLLTRAMSFAVRGHADQCRKGTDIPYIIHSMEVCAIVSEMTGDQEIRAAAVMHDLLEDTSRTYEGIYNYFGSKVADLVQAVSEDDSFGKHTPENWEDRKRAYLDKIEGARKGVQYIVLADCLSNLRSIHRDYRRIGSQVWARFNQPDSARQVWYYRSVLDKLTSVSAKPAMAEARRILDYLTE